MTTTRTCPTCGAEVSANERFCANCGSRMPDQQPVPVAPTVPLGQQSSEPTQALPSIPPLPGSNLSGNPPSGGPAPFVVPPGSTAPPPRRGMPTWLIALLIIGGLLLVGCIALFSFLGFAGSQVGNIFATTEAGLSTAEPDPTGQGGGIVPFPSAEPDPTAQAVPSAEADPTEEAAPTRPPETAEVGPEPTAAPTTSGGGGIAGGVGGGATQAQALAQTQQAQAAVAAETQQLLASGQQVFRDEFADNRNNWFTGVFQEVETDKIEGGVFKVIWAADGSSYELYEPREFTNFIAEVDCLIYQGGVDGSCGLIFSQKNDIGFYKYEVFEDYYRLFVVQQEGDPPVLAEGSPEGIIKPGEPNKLRVIKQGDAIRIYLNEVLLDSVSDATYPSGKVGVSTNSYLKEGGVEVWFDNFTLWQLP